MHTPTQARSAKVAGLCALALMLIGPLSLVFVPSRTVVAGDLAATAALQVAAPGLVRVGLAGELGIVAVELVMIVALLLVFRPISEGLAGAAALARLAMTGVQAANATAGLAALELFLRDGAASSAALLALREAGALVWQALFGLHCAILAALILRSRLVPRALGVSMGMSAGAYLLIGLGALLAPEHRALFESPPVLLAALGEVPFFLWLLVAGLRPTLRTRRDGGVAQRATEG